MKYESSETDRRLLAASGRYTAADVQTRRPLFQPLETTSASGSRQSGRQ